MTQKYVDRSTVDAIVFGATGLIGRSLVAELLGRGQQVAATVRTDTLTPWLLTQGVDSSRLRIVHADITRPLAGLPEARDVYNAAARFAFGLSVEEAKATNVTGAVNVVDWAATLPNLRRVVHISGYRVSSHKGAPDYRRHGAYEASKLEGDAAVRARAAELGVPFNIANPSSVIGPGQYIGLSSMVEDLWNGRLPALPGSREVFLPVVESRYFARFLAEIPHGAPGEAYWVLDDATPLLPELIGLFGDHLGVRAPRRTIPVELVRRLPRKLTGADPETLGFLATDRYPTASARALASAAGLEQPPVTEALREWADHLVATRFGAASPGPLPAGFRDVAGTRTWVRGDTRRPDHVLLHGLPMNGDLWTPLLPHLPGEALVPDLPGQGRSGPGRPGPGRSGSERSGPRRPDDGWLAAMMESVETRPLLIAHSAASGPALHYAAEHPDRVSGLVLISPAFLQAPGSWFTRSRLAVPVMRRMSAARLASVLGVPEGPAVVSAAADLARPGVARRVSAAMRASFAAREELRGLLDRVKVPVEIVVGSEDPLTTSPGHPVTVIAGAGHYPQLTHPNAILSPGAHSRLLGTSAGAR